METEKKTENPVVPPVEEKPKVETSPAKPITMEDLARIEQSALDKYKGIQRVVDKVTKENQRLKEQLNKTQPQPTDFSSLIEVVEKQARESGDNETLSKLAVLRRTEADRVARMDYEKRVTEQARIAQEERDKIETRIKDAGEDPDDPKFATVFLAWELSEAKDGKFERAHNTLDRLLTKKPEPVKVEAKPEAVKESEDARIERLANEKLKATLKERGLLTVEDGVPGAATGNNIPTSAKDLGAFVAGLSQEEYEKTYRKQIDEMMRQGKIK